MTNVPGDMVGEILQNEKFTIVDLSVDPVTSDTVLIIIHDLHPEDEVTVKLVSDKVDGEDSMQLQFEGPDCWTDAEAKRVLNEVMEVIMKIIEKAVEEDKVTIDPVIPMDPEASGSGSGGGS